MNIDYTLYEYTMPYSRISCGTSIMWHEYGRGFENEIELLYVDGPSLGERD